jgi:HAE1 family hydrophobic/amphiphilic exporter-1
MSAWNISATAIRNPIAPIVLFLALIFAGLTAYFRLPINQIPSVEEPVFVVTIARSGAAPTDLETQVAQKVEASLTNVQGVKRVTSELSQGATQVIVELQTGASIEKAVDDARDALQRIRADLPADIEEPVITRLEAAAEPIGTFALEWPGKSELDLSWFIDNDLSRELLAVQGVAQITRSGGVNREIRVALDPEKLLSVGVSADDVSRQLRALNVNAPAGRAMVGSQAQTIRALGGAATIAQLSETRILTSTGVNVRLGDLGAIADASSELSSFARYNGQPVILFSVNRSKGASDVHVYDRLSARIAALEADNPGLDIRVLGTPVEFIKGMHEGSMAALIEGALLAVLVVFLILKDWRATIIAACAIPLATIPTFAGMEMLGFTLNMITLIALGLVAGVLVDDAIVEIENIIRHMRMGKSPYQAALEAADEIGLAVVATSATIIVVFLPVSFMQGMSGQFFREFGITVAMAVFFSLLVARLITPMMAAFFLKKGHDEPPPGRLTKTYEKALSFAVHRPFIAAAMGVGVFILSLVPVATGMVPSTFIPRLDNGMIRMNVQFPPGTPLSDADRTMLQIADIIDDEPEVRGVISTVAGAEGSVSNGGIYIQLIDAKARSRSSNQIEQHLRPQLSGIPDVLLVFEQFQGAGRGSDITLEFVGSDPAAIEAAADRLVAAMRQLPDLVDVRSSAAMKRPEIQLTPRLEEAARLGVSAADLASAVRIATGGDVDQNLARFDLPDRQIPIRVMLRTDAREDVETIRALRVRSSLGPPVRLDAVADVRFSVGDAMIERRDRQRKVTVTANVRATPDNPTAVVSRALEKVMALPETNPGGDVSLLTGGDTEENAEMTEQFGGVMIWGILLIYAVLVLLFRDFFQPVTIMTALPLSIGGAFVGLLFAQQPLSLFVFIGFLMLMGIVTKNSILLVDFAIERMREGVLREDALMEAGMKRARPIIMTTIAMSAGMLPAAMGWGVDGALRQGMGVAVIGGLILSTVLSLIFVPSVFVLIDRFESVVKPWFGRLLATNPREHAHPAE